MSRLVSGLTSEPVHTCPICGESENVRAFKVYMENGDIYSQCIPCSKLGEQALVNGKPTEGWFIEPYLKSTMI